MRHEEWCVRAIELMRLAKVILLIDFREGQWNALIGSWAVGGPLAGRLFRLEPDKRRLLRPAWGGP